MNHRAEHHPHFTQTLSLIYLKSNLSFFFCRNIIFLFNLLSLKSTCFQKIAMLQFLISHLSIFFFFASLNIRNWCLFSFIFVLLGSTQCLSLSNSLRSILSYLWSLPTLKHLQLVNILYQPRCFSKLNFIKI